MIWNALKYYCRFQTLMEMEAYFYLELRNRLPREYDIWIKDNYLCYEGDISGKFPIHHWMLAGTYNTIPAYSELGALWADVIICEEAKFYGLEEFFYECKYWDIRIDRKQLRRN